MRRAGLARGVGAAADSGLPEGVGLMGADEGLDEGVAPGPGGAEAAPACGFEPPEVAQFLCTPAKVCVPAAPLRKNPLIRKRLVIASAAVCAMDALASKMDTLTVCEPPRCDACQQGMSAAVGAISCIGALADDATPAAEQQVPLVVTVVIYAHYACVADCADAMADAWEDTAGCAQAICLHENLLKCQYIGKWGLHGIVHI